MDAESAQSPVVRHGIAAEFPRRPYERSDTGRPLALFVTLAFLGWRTHGERIAAAAADRTDFESLHLQLTPPLWVQVLTHPFRVPRFLRWLFSNGDGLCRLRPADRVWSRWLRGSLQTFARDAGIDWIHFSPSEAGLACLGNPVPFSISLDATTRGFAEQLGERASRKAIERQLDTLAAAELIYCMSEWSRRDVLSESAALAEKTEVILPAGRIKDRQHPLAAGRQRDARIVFVGNNWDRKGGDRLLEWHQRHFAERARLFIASADAPRADLPGVVWLGTVENKRLVDRLLPMMDMLVLPTRFDQSPQVLFEAAAAGLPIVASRMAGTPDAVVDGVTGFLIDPTDDVAFVAAIERLITDQQLRGEMSASIARRNSVWLNERVQFGHMFDLMLQRLDPQRQISPSPSESAGFEHHHLR